MSTFSYLFGVAWEIGVHRVFGRVTSRLLAKLHYNSTNDLLIHTGDIVAKGPHSNELLSRFAGRDVTGVRGNNDQKVIGKSATILIMVP